MKRTSVWWGVGFLLAALSLCLAIYGPVWFAETPVELPFPEAALPNGDQRILRFVSDPWLPYAGIAGTAQEGYVVDILRTIFEPQGFQILYSNEPWSRCIFDTRNGYHTGIIGAELQDAPDLIFPREPIGVNMPAFYTSPGSSWVFSGVQELTRIRLGLIQDYFYHPDLEEFTRLHRGSDHLVLARGNDALDHLVTLLRENHIDALVENRMVVSFCRDRKAAFRDLREAGALVPGGALFVAFSPRIPRARELVAMLDDGIRNLRESDKLIDVLRPYGLHDWHSLPASTAIPLDTVAGPAVCDP